MTIHVAILNTSHFWLSLRLAEANLFLSIFHVLHDKQFSHHFFLHLGTFSYL